MSLIIRLLIVPVFAFMAQTAPLEHNCVSVRSNVLAKAKNRSELQNQTVHLYCVAISLHDTVYRNKIVVQDVQLPNIPIQNTKFNQVFRYFSDECKNFTVALSLKHHLQEYLFNETNNSTDSQQIRPLYSVLVYLQMLANILDDIQFNNHSVRCVRLTANQYKMMYHVLQQQQQDVSLLDSLIDDWTAQNYYLQHFKDGAPSTCTCKIIYPTLDCLL